MPGLPSLDDKDRISCHILIEMDFYYTFSELHTSAGVWTWAEYAESGLAVAVLTNKVVSSMRGCQVG